MGLMVPFLVLFVLVILVLFSLKYFIPAVLTFLWLLDVACLVNINGTKCSNMKVCACNEKKKGLVLFLPVIVLKLSLTTNLDKLRPVYKLLDKNILSIGWSSNLCSSEPSPVIGFSIIISYKNFNSLLALNYLRGFVN